MIGSGGVGIQKRVFVFEIVEVVPGHDLDDWQRLVAYDSDGQLAAFDELLDEQLAAVGSRLRERGRRLRRRAHDENADARALAWRFEDVWHSQRRLGVPAQNLKRRCRHTALDETPLAGDFIDREFARRDPFASVLHAARFKNALNLAILAKGPVDRIECDFDMGRHHEIRTCDIHLGDLRTKLPQCLCHAGTRRE
jgi:hypothetical protein